MSDRLTQLRKLYDADPRDAFVTYGIAMEHAKLGDAEEAIAWLNQTLEIDPHYCYAYFQKGRLLAELGREHEARLTLNEGLTRAREAGDDHAASEIGALLESVS